MKITKRLYIGRLSAMNVPLDDTHSLIFRKFLFGTMYILWKTLKTQS